VDDTRQPDQDGFSLVELLVVIVVLGILATIAVFAVRGVTDRGNDSACKGDEHVLTDALESRNAKSGSYASELTLKQEGLIHAESTLHDITLGANAASYTIVGIGDCA
jgi:prepilin-type N-terminal cleavage/methylation domain-containing protein